MGMMFMPFYLLERYCTEKPTGDYEMDLEAGKFEI